MCEISRQNRKIQFSSVKMSSDVDDDQVLPESLQKLEIVPDYLHSQSACKANNERNNPFFSELSRTNGIDDRVSIYVRMKKMRWKKQQHHTQ